MGILKSIMQTIKDFSESLNSDTDFEYMDEIDLPEELRKEPEAVTRVYGSNKKEKIKIEKVKELTVDQAMQKAAENPWSKEYEELEDYIR